MEVTGLTDLTVANIDAEKLRLENLIRTGIHPRIPGIVIHQVSLRNGRLVLCIRIPRSWIGPHVVNFQGHWRFYGRSLARKYPLEVEEVRTAVLAGESAAERIRAFRADRLHRVLTHDTPVPLVDFPRVVLHLIPLASATSLSGVDLAALASQPNEFRPVSREPVGNIDHRYNLDGFVVYVPGQGGAIAYTQVFCNGILECVEQCPVERRQDHAVLLVTSLEKRLIDLVTRLVGAQDRFGVAPPVVAMVGVTGVNGHVISVDSLRAGAHPVHGIDRDPILLPDVLIDDLKVDTAKVATYLRPIFDALWNAAGLPRSLNYDGSGQWKPAQ